MTNSTHRHGVPANAGPSVFHHDGRRLLLIDGEPRIVDVDIGEGLAFDRSRDVRKIIARQVENLSFFGDVLRFDPTSNVVERVGEQLRHGGAIARPADPALVRLLQDEGLLDLSKRGKKPTIWLLNREQMRWIVTKSETEQADEFLRELFRVYKAWEDGALQPARPAVPPPQAQAQAQAQDPLPPPAVPVGPPTAIVFNGVAYELVGGDLHVVDESLYRAGGWTASGMRSTYTDLPAVGPMPASASLKGAALLSVRHVDFLVAALRVGDEEVLSPAFLAVPHVLRAHAHGQVEVFGGTLVERLGPDGVSRQYAAGRSGGRKVSGWAPAPFIRDDGRALLVRHCQVAMAFGLSDRMLLLALGDHRGDVPGEVFERHERQHGLEVIGVYLTEAQCVMLGIAMGLDGAAIVGRMFDLQVELESDLRARAMADLAAVEAHRVEAAGVPTLPASIVALKEAIAAVSGAAAGMAAAVDRIQGLAEANALMASRSARSASTPAAGTARSNDAITMMAAWPFGLVSGWSKASAMPKPHVLSPVGSTSPTLRSTISGAVPQFRLPPRPNSPRPTPSGRRLPWPAARRSGRSKRCATRLYRSSRQRRWARRRPIRSRAAGDRAQVYDGRQRGRRGLQPCRPDAAPASACLPACRSYEPAYPALRRGRRLPRSAPGRCSRPRFGAPAARVGEGGAFCPPSKSPICLRSCRRLI